MKLFKIYFSFFVIVGLFFGVSLFFPRQYKFTSSIEINKPVSEVFSFMNDFRNWEKWSVWNKTMDSSLFIFYSKRSDSLGARQYFEGKILGKGRFLITKYSANEILGYNLYLHEGDVNANGTFFFKQKNNSTELIWVDSGDVGYNPIFRYMIPFKRNSTEASFQEGLTRIKEKTEN